MDDVQDMIVGSRLRSYSLQTCNELVQSRWLMIEQAQTGLPTVFLGC